MLSMLKGFVLSHLDNLKNITSQFGTIAELLQNMTKEVAVLGNSEKFSLFPRRWRKRRKEGLCPLLEWEGLSHFSKSLII